MNARRVSNLALMLPPVIGLIAFRFHVLTLVFICVAELAMLVPRDLLHSQSRVCRRTGWCLLVGLILGLSFGACLGSAAVQDGAFQSHDSGEDTSLILMSYVIKGGLLTLVLAWLSVLTAAFLNFTAARRKRRASQQRPPLLHALFPNRTALSCAIFIAVEFLSIGSILLMFFAAVTSGEIEGVSTLIIPLGLLIWGCCNNSLLFLLWTLACSGDNEAHGIAKCLICPTSIVCAFSSTLRLVPMSAPILLSFPDTLFQLTLCCPIYLTWAWLNKRKTCCPTQRPE